MPGSGDQWRWWPFWIGQWSMNLLICWLTAFIFFIFLSLANHWGSFTQYPRSVLRRSKLSWRVVLIWRCHGKQFIKHRKAWNFTPYWSILSMLFFGISFLIRRFPTLLPCICGLTMEFPFLIVSCLWSLSFSLCLFRTGSIWSQSHFKAVVTCEL